jgi:hypothetical protein
MTRRIGTVRTRAMYFVPVGGDIVRMVPHGYGLSGPLASTAAGRRNAAVLPYLDPRAIL